MNNPVEIILKVPSATSRLAGRHCGGGGGAEVVLAKPVVATPLEMVKAGTPPYRGGLLLEAQTLYPRATT
ncbi:MAG: hypothetical protein NTY53_24985 [Kiritimatiellaeota bacterium]|nr:hypothetical protein [Kiritimatiellota bacterium]